MADDQVLDDTPDTSVAGAAAAIEALLKGPGTGEQPQQPETPQIQPQAPVQQAQPQSGAGTSEVVQAPASEVPATAVVEQPKVQSASSPELEQRMGEAAKATQEATAARDNLLNALNTLVPQLEATVKGEFSDIKTKDDLYALADPRSPNYNVERYNAAIIAFSKLNDAIQARDKVQVDAQKEQTEKLTKWREAETAKVADLIPELKDKTNGPVLANRIEKFALESGYTPQQLSMASAIQFRTLYESMLFRDGEAKKAADIAEANKKAANAPPVQQPGARQSDDKGNQVQEQYTRLQKTGRLDDAAALIRNLL